MALLSFTTITIQDLCTQALKETGAWGTGQTPSAEDIVDSWFRLQLMLGQWNRKRWMVWHLVDKSIVSTGAQSYTVGPGGQIDTGANSNRPARIESAFLRQLNVSPNQVDYDLELLQSREDYNRIALKGLVSFPGFLFYDSAFPLGSIFLYPVAQASIYEIHISILEQLPSTFTTLATVITLPFEYYAAVLANLAETLCPKFGMTVSGDLKRAARDGRNVVRSSNFQIPRLKMPAELLRRGVYNIFSDRAY